MESNKITLNMDNITIYKREAIILATYHTVAPHTHTKKNKKKEKFVHFQKMLCLPAPLKENLSKKIIDSSRKLRMERLQGMEN